jgi:thiol-disulfide isomerase/thioredoxin
MKRLAAIRRIRLHRAFVTLMLVAVPGCTPSTPRSGPAPRTTEPPVAPAPIVNAPQGEAPPSSAEQPAVAEPAARTERAPIYVESADARADIKAALERAAYDHKRVLVKFGGNWCSWCYKLHDVFTHDPDVAPLLRSEYELVLVDVNSNTDLLQEFDPDNDRHSYPWLTVLDADGQVLVNQNTEPLEQGPQHEPAKVKAFLEQWRAAPLDAEQVLASGFVTAGDENKRVLVHVGAPWCGWCRVLDRFLLEQRDLIGLDYLDVKIDVDRMTHGPDVEQRLRATGRETGGIPWMAILDADGTILVTSDGPSGNIGYPYQPQEIEHFVAMLNQTRQNITDAQVGQLEQRLRDYAAARIPR